MTELLLTQQLESPSGTGRVDPEVTSGSQAPNQTNGMPTSQPPHSHWQLCAISRDRVRQSAALLHQTAPGGAVRDLVHPVPNGEAGSP